MAPPTPPDAAASAGACMAGRQTVNVEPAPGALVTATRPPLCVTMPYTVDRPRPVPLPGPLVVKNGSNTRACVAASMPVPVYSTASITCGPACAPGASVV